VVRGLESGKKGEQEGVFGWEKGLGVWMDVPPAGREGLKGSGPLGLVEVVFRNGVGLSGIEVGALVEVLGGRIRGRPLMLL
jgi:hypothetical protein